MNTSNQPPPRVRPRPLAIAWQALVLLAVVAAIAWMAHNVGANLRARGVPVGFGFLNETAGFAISEGPYPYDIGDSYLQALVAGIANTLRAALPAALLATVLGFALGVAQISRNALVSRLARAYVDVVRNIPLLVQLLLWYIVLTEGLPQAEAPLQWTGVAALSKAGLHLAVPDSAAGMGAVLASAGVAALLAWAWGRVVGRGGWIAGAAVAALAWWYLPIGWDRPAAGTFGVDGGAALSTEWLALVGALSLFAAAYCAEIVRAGLQSVGRGQWDAALALGLTRGQTLRGVILPQGLRVMLPPYTSLLMNTLKNSSLAIAVGYPDLVSVATTSLNQTGQAVECIAVIAGVYLGLNLLTALVMGAVNAFVQIKER